MSFDTNRSLHSVYSSNCGRGVHTHCTVYSFALDNINTANMRSRAVSNTNVVLSHCVHCIELCMYRSSSAVCVMVSQYVSMGMCERCGWYCSCSLYSECMIGFVIYVGAYECKVWIQCVRGWYAKTCAVSMTLERYVVVTQLCENCCELWILSVYAKVCHTVFTVRQSKTHTVNSWCRLLLQQVLVQQVWWLCFGSYKYLSKWVLCEKNLAARIFLVKYLQIRGGDRASAKS